MKQRVAVLGAGAYGTAIARDLSYKGHHVLLWSHKKNQVLRIQEDRENKIRLPGVILPDSLHPTASLEEACSDCDALIFAVPSLYLMEVLRALLGFDNIIEARPRIAAVTKGFISGKEGPELVLTALERYLPGAYKNHLVYISGPSQAEEMGRDKLTGLISASLNAKNALYFRNLLGNTSLMVFPSFDVIGVQVSASVKNAIAIAFGMLDALKEIDPLVGDNTESLLFAAGLNEIQILGTSLGATHPETFTSIAGVGDLDVSCRSPYGRNRRFGRQIILENILKPFKDFNDLIQRIAEVGYLAEGIPATGFAYELGNRKSLKLPVLRSIYRILNREIEALEILQSFRQGSRYTIK